MRLFLLLLSCLLPSTLVWVSSVQSEEKVIIGNQKLPEYPLRVVPIPGKLVTQGPQLSVSATSGYAGRVVALTGSNYSSGNGSILWNGNKVDTVPISRVGTFRKDFTIPEGAF